MKKVLMITCLNTSKEKFDGERIKCTLIYNSLKKFTDLDVINLSVYKVINTIKIFFKALFLEKKYEYVVISKDAHGANIIQKILRLGRYPSSRIVYFEIGPFLYDRILNGSIKKETFINDKLIVVETNSMKEELKEVGFERIGVFPNFKPICRVPFNEQKYPKEVLKLVYLSRIEEPKGIYDLINCLSVLNKDKTMFILDVYGRPQNAEEEKKIKDLSNKYKFVRFLGMLEVGSEGSYKQLSQYDLHVFPTKYREGFPGSIIDFFIAGVPTLSSSFARAHEILTENDSIVFKQGDNNALQEKLVFIYNNQNKLNELRKNSFSRREQYSVESFEKYLKRLIDNDFKDIRLGSKH